MLVLAGVACLTLNPKPGDDNALIVVMPGGSNLKMKSWVAVNEFKLSYHNGL